MALTLKNSKGFTLIEFLVAILIISVGMLALLKSITLSLTENTKTKLRNQAVMLADERMTLEKSKPFNDIPADDKTYVTMNVNNAFVNYSVETIQTKFTDDTKNIEIDFTWKYKGTRFVHTISSVVGK